ncbi:MAG: ABC transporter ATP-binding protein, partial [Spirochaetota bacterium]
MLLTTQELSVGYPKNPAILEKVNMAIEPSKMYALLGPNGSGKSTFIRTLSGLVTPLAGKIILDQSIK